MVSPVVERLAVFIDGENMSADMFDEISERANLLGECVIWKVFGDLSNNGHADWLGVCRRHGLQPMLELPLESGKNSTDIAIVIAAMDLLPLAAVEALVLVSDDRDFLPLVRRLRAGGLNVHGLGRRPENTDLYRFHTSWAKLQPKAVPRIAARMIKVSQPVTDNKEVPTPKAATAAKRSPPTPPPETADLADYFVKVVQTKLTAGMLTLSALGKWIRQEHPKLVPLLGKGKLKKRLANIPKFRLADDSVSLSKER